MSRPSKPDVLGLHPRFSLVQSAKKDLLTALCDWIEKHRLTPLEVSILLGDEQRQWLTYALRYERHGKNPEGKKADEA